MLFPLAQKQNSTNCHQCSSFSRKGFLDKFPGCERWQTSHCRAIVQVTVSGGPSGSATAHNRGLLLSAGGRLTGTREKKCGRCSVSESDAAFHGWDFPVRALGFDCRWLPVPGGFGVVAGRGGGGDPPGSGHG